MKTNFAALLARLDGLKPRERVLVFAAAAVLLVMAFDKFLYTPQRNQIKQQHQVLDAVKMQANNMATELTRLSAQPDPNALLRQRIQIAESGIQQRMAENDALSRGLVRPGDMPQVLSDLLRQSPGLRVLGLRNLPPEPVANSGSVPPAVPAQSAGSSHAALYRHGVELRLEGSYAGLVDYMSKLEHMPHGMYWGSATLDAQNYPRLYLSLTLYTLSLESAWLSL